MAKNNARTFRYSDEVANILQSHNNDFDSLVLECFYKLPEVQEETERLKKVNEQLKKEYREIYNEIKELRQIKYELDVLENTIKRLNKEF